MDPPNKVTIPGLTLLFGNLHTQPEEHQTNNSTDSPMLDGSTDNPLTTEEQQVVSNTPSPAPAADPVTMAPSEDLAAPSPDTLHTEPDLPGDTTLTAMDTASDDTNPDVEDEPKIVVPRRCLRCKNIKKGCSGGIPCDLCTRSGLTADECEMDVEYDEAQRKRLAAGKALKGRSGAIPNASTPKRSMSPKKRGRPPGSGARSAAKEASAAAAFGTDMSASAATDTPNLDPGTTSTTPPDSPPFSNAQLMSIGDSITSEGDLQTPPSRAPTAAFAQMAIQATPPHFQQVSAPMSIMSQQSDSDSASSGGTNKRRATPAKTPRKKAESPTPRAPKEKKANANGDGAEKKPKAPRKRATKKSDPKGVGPNGATPAQGSGLRNEILQDDGSDKTNPSTPTGFTQPFGTVGQTPTSFIPGQVPAGSSANAPYYPWVMRPFGEQAGNSSARGGPPFDSDSHNAGVQSPAMPDARAQIAHVKSMSDRINSDLGIAGTEAQFSVDVEQEMLRAEALERASAIPKTFADAVDNHQRQVSKDFQLSADSLTCYKVSDNTASESNSNTGEPSNGTGEAGPSVIPSKRNTPPNGDPNAFKRPRTAEPQPAAATTPVQPAPHVNNQQPLNGNNQQTLNGNIEQAPNGNNQHGNRQPALYSNGQQAPYMNSQPAAYTAQQPINQDPIPFPAPLQHSDDPRGHLLTQIVSIADRIHRSHAGVYPGYLQHGAGPVPPPPPPVVHAFTPSELRAMIVFAPGVSISTYARLTPAMAVAAEAERYLWWFQQTFGEEDMVAGLPYDVPPPGHNWARLRLDKPLPARWSADMRPQGDWPVGGLVE